MTVTITPEEATLFENNGFSYDDVNNTVQHYRKEGLSDDAIQQKINTRIVQFRNSLGEQNKEALNNSLKELPEDNKYVKTQKHQTDALANMLFTSDELKTMELQGKMGWVEYRSRGFVGWSDILPFVGTIKEGYQAGKVLSLSKKFEKGEEMSDADKAYMKNYLRNYVEIQKRGMTWSAKGASMTVQAPSFMVEFALSGGLGEIAAKGAIKGAAKGATKAAVKGATKTAARVAGQQAVLVPMYATANYNERKIADGLNITDKGDMLFDSKEAEGNNKSNFLKGLTTGEIQVLSELSGGLLGKMAGGAIGVAQKSLGKVATTNVARGISATTAKVYNSLPKNVRVKLEASARLAQDFGKSAAVTGEKMKSKGLEFHGIAEEMGEERVEDILMTAFDVDSKEGYSADQWMDAIFPSPQQLLLEAGVFSIVGGTSLATRTVANDLLSKGYSEQETKNIVNSLSEIEKENLANDIIGEVKINEDITEEEVQQEQNAIQMKLFGGVEMNVNEQGEETINPEDKNIKTKLEAQIEKDKKNAKNPSFYNGFNVVVKNGIVRVEKNGIISKSGFQYDEGATTENTGENWNLDAIGNLIQKWNNENPVKTDENGQTIKETQSAKLSNMLAPKQKKVQKPIKLNYIKQTRDGYALYENPKTKTMYMEKDGKFYDMKYREVNKDFETDTVKYNNTPAFYDMADTAGATKSEEAKAKKEWKEKGVESKYFKKWFGDSKVVDENGKPLVVYHGTPNAVFNEFKNNSHFTANKDYADSYQNTSASSISVKKSADNPQTYAVYLSIKNPFDTRDEKARNIFLNEYQAYYSPELTDKGMVDWMEVEDLTEWLKENHPEYDGIFADEGGVPIGLLGSGEFWDRGVSYIPFASTQIKSVDNQGTFDENNPNIYYDTEGGRTRKTTPKKETTQTPVTQEAETVEEEIEVPETVADKIIRGESWFGKKYTEWVDRYTPIENLVKKAEQKTGETLNTSNNPYYQARMYAGLVESIKQQVNDKTFVKENGKIKITGEGFLPIINDYVEEVKEIEPEYETAIEDLSDYLIANRYLLDLKDRDGYEATEEQKLKAVEDMTKLNIKYGDKIDDISKIADRIYAFNQRILHNLVDSGNMSQETYDKIIEQNPHHISYKRVMDDNNWGTAFVSKGKFTDAKSPVKKIRGSERDIQNIFVSTLEDVARILDVAERNKVARSVANLKDILPEYIQVKKPAMEKRTAKVKVNYDAKMRQQLLEAIKFFGNTFANVKSIKTPTGYALGSYSAEEQMVRKKLGSQDRTLAHEVGHMLDFALGVQSKIRNNKTIMQEISTLAEDRFESIVKLQDGEFITEDGGSTEKYKNYAKTNEEMIANAFDLYFTSRDYVKRVAPETAKFIDSLFKGKYKFLNDIRPSSESATEEIEQDVWTPSRNKPYGNVVEYFVDGKPKFIEVTKPVMDAVEGLNSQEIDFINKFFVGSASMLRTGATITPEFAIRNFIRDQESAVIYIKNYNPFIDGVKGLMNVLNKKITGKNATYDEWVKAGGAFGSYMELNEKSVNKALKEFVGEESKMRNIFSYANPLKLAEEFSSIFEQATRLGMYTRSKMNGSTAMEAALESREGTLDFGRSGSLGRKYNKVLPFFNAGIQGVDKMVRTFRDHPYLSSIKAIGSITLPQLALTGYYLYAAPDDDREEYLNIPQYQKDFFYCFKVGNNWVRIPKDFTLGYVFGSVPERFMTWAFENKKPEGKDLAEMVWTLFGSVSPINNPTDALPPILRTLIENTANYDFFRGQHIYPEYMDNLEPSMRANKFNSETSKILGEKLNMSPAKIDHTISSLLGTSGKYLTDAGDLMIDSVRKFNGEETVEKVKTAADAPFIRGFVLRDPIGYQTVSTNEFFDNYKTVSQAHSTYNKYLKTDREAARNYKEKHEADLRAYNKLNNTKKQISDIGKRMDKIYADKTLTNKEKQEQLKPLAKRISDMAFDANVWYGEFKKEQ